jgi:hypothetical protein
MGRLGVGDGDFDQADGVVCLGLEVDVPGLATADAKERVVCLKPGLRELAAAMLYCLMTSCLLCFREITV